jgi:type II secretory pathway component PulF
MAEFFYKASDRAGKVVQGSLDAPDQSAVVAQLRKMGYIPIRIDTPATRRSSASSWLNLNLDLKLINPFGGVSGKALLAFTQELATLIKAGLPLDRSLSIIAEVTDNERLKKVAEEVLRDVRGGRSLSDAFAKHPAVFNRLYISMVRAGEAGGVLDIVFDRLTEFLERSQNLKSTVTNAIFYPVALIIVMGLVVAALIVFIIPRFVDIFDTLGQDLPASTRLLLYVSNIITGYWWLVLLIGFSLYYWFKKYSATETGRRRLDSLYLRIFMVKDLILKVEVARFARTLGTLINSGVPILQALAIVKDVVGNVIIAASIARIHKEVKEGKGVSGPMRADGVFPPLAVHMLRVGEETGRMEEMLIKVADTYDTEVHNAVKRFTSFLEPALILTMAVIVVGVIVPIILAIVSINDVRM